MMLDESDEEMHLIAEAVAADEAREWARPSITQRIRRWFLCDPVDRRRRAVEKEAQSLGASEVIWKDSNHCEIVWE